LVESVPLTSRVLWVLFLLISLANGVLSQSIPPQATKAVPAQSSAPNKKPDVIFVPTRQAVVDKMLALAEIKTNDILYDLGCGDGRIVVTAAKQYGVRAVGVDIDPERIRESLDNVSTNNVAHLVTIKQADIFELDFSEATVVTLYLLPDLNVRLMPKLAKLKPGTRIVSNSFDMRGAKPKEVVHLEGNADEGYSQRTVYKWVVPWEPE
jgi:predicted RNA methylase